MCQRAHRVVHRLEHRVTLPRSGVAGGREVNFVACTGNSFHYYQVCAALDSASTIEREFAALEAVDDQWPKAVLTFAPAPITGRNGIPVIPLRDFLLGTEQRGALDPQ